MQTWELAGAPKEEGPSSRSGVGIIFSVGWGTPSPTQEGLRTPPPLPPNAVQPARRGARELSGSPASVPGAPPLPSPPDSRAKDPGFSLKPESTCSALLTSAPPSEPCCTELFTRSGWGTRGRAGALGPQESSGRRFLGEELCSARRRCRKGPAWENRGHKLAKGQTRKQAGCGLPRCCPAPTRWFPEPASRSLWF